MRTILEIKKKIKKLSKERQALPRYSMFGTDNWWQIIIQEETLEKALKSSPVNLKVELDDICDRYKGEGRDGNFPPDDTMDKWIVDALDWLLENTEDL